ncbi:MAG: HDOD domain-containing protein, partial [Pseudomonadota bacterium]|nr:HDOD domain-containing protein [Pseudomonadota bacterium]
VRFAIAFVGLGEIYRIVMALAVIESIGVTDQRELEDFWFHSYLSTLIAKDVAVHYLSYLPLDELWSAALLHDIGRLVYARFFPEHLRAIRAYAQDQGCTLDSAESALELPSSALFGEGICRHWGLPQRVRDACAHHHLVDLADMTQDGTLRGDFIRTVGIGHVLSEMCLEKLSDACQRDITGQVMENLGCDEPAFLDLIARVYACREEVNAFIRHML